ncbi:hypothetical protein STW0522KLE44_19490 [Klebsiella sp. STW0522-44]|nr:hypothetical protein STW0522KLE44_19490 [Klebsiella sp. STW0522-44]
MTFFMVIMAQMSLLVMKEMIFFPAARETTRYAVAAVMIPTCLMSAMDMMSFMATLTTRGITLIRSRISCAWVAAFFLTRYNCSERMAIC